MIIVSLAVAGATAAFSQEPPTISAELKALEWQIGTWEGTVKWSMPGMEGDSKMTMKSEWEGLFMKQTSTTEMQGMKMLEVGYLGYDPDKKKYSFHTFTSFAPTPRIEWGTVEGTKAVFVSDPWNVMGQVTSSRATVVKKGDSEMAFTLEFKQGNSWSKVAEGTFKKKG
jgi:hypothetical protein